MYLSKLNDRGIIVAHISNRHLDLSRVLARIGAEHGLVTYLNTETAIPPTFGGASCDSPQSWRFSRERLNMRARSRSTRLGSS